MRFINLKVTKSICIGLFVVLFIIAPFGKSLAQSEKERMAQLVEGAKKEGKLVYYTSQDMEESTKLLNRFHEKYPFIETELYRTSGEKMLSRIMSESLAKKYLHDAMMLSGFRIGEIKKKGLSVGYISPEAKAYSDVFKDPQGHWTATYVNFIVTAYNTKLVSPQEVPKTWTALLDPKWKGKIGIPTNSEYWFFCMLQIMGEKKGLDFMKKFSQQNLAWRSGASLNTELLAAGEFSIAARQFNQAVEEFKAKGAPIEWVAFEPVIPQKNVVSLAANAPHPNAARLFADFMLSKEAMTIQASFYRIPARDDVDPLIPRMKCKGLKIFAADDDSIINGYERLEKLYREVLMGQ